MPTALILDSDPESHGATVQSYFGNDKPSGWSVSDIYDDSFGIGTVEEGVDQAIANGDKMIIRSQSGGWDSKDEWDRAWSNGILVVHSHGSNSNTELTDPPRLFSALVVGGESPAGGYEDERSFGPGLEVDAVAHDGSTAESWATPTVAAILARLYDIHGDWFDARAILRQMALRNNAEGEWSEERGYGMVASPNHTDDTLDVGGDAGYGYNGADQWANRPTAPSVQPPLDVRAAPASTTEALVEWLPFETSTFSQTRVQIGGADEAFGVGTTSYVYERPPGKDQSPKEYTATLSSLDNEGAESPTETATVTIEEPSLPPILSLDSFPAPSRRARVSPSVT